MSQPTELMDTEPSFQLSDAERDLLPGKEDIAFYQSHGWYISKPLLSAKEVDRLWAASEAFYAGHRDRSLPFHPSTLAYWTQEKGDVQRHNDYIHFENREIGEILTKPIIGAVAAAIAKAEAMRVFQSTLIYKPPRADEKSNLVPWHFDKHYWSTSSSHNMLTAFIPFHDCGEEMGTITMIDRSHQWREIQADDNITLHFAKRDHQDLEELLQRNANDNSQTVKKIPMEIPKGCMSFHHCRIYHGSGANRSDTARRAISLHLQDGDNHRQAYVLSDGEELYYNHDHLVQRDADDNPDYSDPDYCPMIWDAKI
jgi:ectoine hydroxylase-related dioxygenase (phytanoyl-CoA dioxygenase family)